MQMYHGETSYIQVCYYDTLTFPWDTSDFQMCHGETSYIQVCRSDTLVFPWDTSDM